MNKFQVRDVINFFYKNKIWYYVEILEKIFKRYDIKYYFVGGAVRDALMFLLNPTQQCSIQDIDIVVCNNRISFLIDKIKMLKQFKDSNIKQYPQFFTASIILQNYRIDLSSPRKEIYNFSGALPVVSKGNIYEDLLRRDFTINSIGLVYDKNSDYYEFYDPFNGKRDIEKGLVRILHKKSFFDDPTRIVRAIRFAASFKYNLEKDTEKCLIKAINDNVFKNISQERLINEFVHILRKCDNIDLAVKMLKKYGIIKSYIFINDFLQVLEKSGPRLNLREENISKEDKYYIRLLYIVEKLYKRSNFNNIKNFIKQKLSILKLKKEEKLKINTAIDFLYYGKKYSCNWLKTYVKIFNKKIFVPLISARDLIKLGLKPSPLLGEVLIKVKELQYKGRLKTKLEAINFVRKLLRLK